MTRNLREEVDIAPYVERGVVDVSDPAVRDNINTLLTGALGQCFITPYIALEKVRKVLAYYQIFIPKTTFLEGDRGVEVFKVDQFGLRYGMKDNGQVVNFDQVEKDFTHGPHTEGEDFNRMKTPETTDMYDKYSVYFEYKMNEKGMFDVFCEIVTQEELNDLIDNVEDEINDEDIEDDRENRLNEEQLDESKTMKVVSGEHKGKNVKKIRRTKDGYIVRTSDGKEVELSHSDLRESSAETGTKQYPGGPEIQALIPSIISEVKMRKKLEEDTKERDAAWEEILKNKNKKSKSNPNPASVARFLRTLTGEKRHLKVVKEEDIRSVHPTQAELEEEMWTAPGVTRYGGHPYRQMKRVQNRGIDPSLSSIRQQNAETMGRMGRVARDYIPGVQAVDFARKGEYGNAAKSAAIDAAAAAAGVGTFKGVSRAVSNMAEPYVAPLAAKVIGNVTGYGVSKPTTLAGASAKSSIGDRGDTKTTPNQDTQSAAEKIRDLPVIGKNQNSITRDLFDRYENRPNGNFITNPVDRPAERPGGEFLQKLPDKPSDNIGKKPNIQMNNMNENITVSYVRQLAEKHSVKKKS